MIIFLIKAVVLMFFRHSLAPKLQRNFPTTRNAFFPAIGVKTANASPVAPRECIYTYSIFETEANRGTKRYISGDVSYSPVSGEKKLVNQLSSQLARPFTPTGSLFYDLIAPPNPVAPTLSDLPKSNVDICRSISSERFVA